MLLAGVHVVSLTVSVKVLIARMYTATLHIRRVGRSGKRYTSLTSLARVVLRAVNRQSLTGQVRAVVMTLVQTFVELALVLFVDDTHTLWQVDCLVPVVI